MSPQSIRTTIAGWIGAPRIRAAALSVAALLGAIIAVPQMQSNQVGEMAAAVADAPAQLVKSVQQAVESQYLGFDTNIYPGDRTMAAWAKDGTYDWVGYYLEAPCHKDDSWSGKRDTLTKMGWGVAVVYVGQQSWSTKKRTKKGSTCSNAFVTAANGSKDAKDAIAKVVAEGFAHGTVIFLDIERMDKVTPAMKTYFTAWSKAVLADGRYQPGYYSHVDNAAAIYADVKPLFVAAGDSTDPPFWIAGHSNAFSTDKLPTDVGHTFAAVWQGLLDVTRTHSGIKLPIDINVSGARSPSQLNASP
jgi:glycoside hydrolase-like protein